LSSQSNKFDCVVEACGDSQAVNNGFKFLKPGGAYVFVGMVHPKTKLDITGEQVIRKCLTLIGIHNYQGYHLRKSVDFLHRTINKYPYNDLIAPKKFTLNDLPEAIEFAKRKDYARVAVRP
jgi:threonine dehydrogenase-like Zn-dependent dehydrogenase